MKTVISVITVGMLLFLAAYCARMRYAVVTENRLKQMMESRTDSVSCAPDTNYALPQLEKNQTLILGDSLIDTGSTLSIERTGPYSCCIKGREDGGINGGNGFIAKINDSTTAYEISGRFKFESNISQTCIELGFLESNSPGRFLSPAASFSTYRRFGKLSGSCSGYYDKTCRLIINKQPAINPAKWNELKMTINEKLDTISYFVNDSLYLKFARKLPFSRPLGKPMLICTPNDFFGFYGVQLSDLRIVCTRKNNPQ
jgi:hypothetical protein